MKWLKPLGAAFFLLLICLNPASAVIAASDSLYIWASSVVPSLLPFLIATPALTCPEVAQLLSRISRGFFRLFRLPEHSTGVLFIGLLSGSPGGAAALSTMNRSPSDSAGALLRASLMASGASPAFLLNGIALGMLNEPYIGWLLFRAQIGAILLTGLLLRSFGRERPCILSIREHPRSGAVLSAMLTLLTIGGYMTLFSVLARQLSTLLSPALETPLLAILELAGGCNALAALPVAMDLKLPLISAAACFGGISVYAQCLSFLKPLGIDPLEYAVGKLFQAALCALLTFLQLKIPLKGIDPLMGAMLCLSVLIFILMLYTLFQWHKKRNSVNNEKATALGVSPKTVA